MTRGFLVVIALAGASACAANAARSSSKVPLEIPEPPPRAAMDPLLVADPPPPEEPEPETVAPPPISKPPAPPPVAAAPAPPPAPVTVPEPIRTTPPPELKPAASAVPTPTASQMRDRIGRARQKLDGIDRRYLNAGKRTDYDSARRFLLQAETAVGANNLLLAESSVEKAETLASGLR